MKKKCKVVMLATENYSPIVNSTSRYGGLFNSDYYSPMKEMGDSYQHLYITLDDEIKEGDYAYYPLLNEVMKVDKGEIYEEGKQLKIIATTDELVCKVISTKLGVTQILPQLPQSFINQYIESYNKGNVITEVMVEYTNCDRHEDCDGNFNGNCSETNPKINPDNTINISTIKDNWNREEVIEIIKIINSHSKESVNKWIEENL